jgi:hypothetical protein
MIPGAGRALILMEELGILDFLLPFLSAHLRSTELENTATVQNLALMGQAIEQSASFSRSLTLACVYADFYLARMRDLAPPQRFALVEALRARGFAKVDTEHMRLLLEAALHLAARSQALRRLARRPYFAEARSLFELIVPTTGADPASIDSLLAPPAIQAARPPRRRRRRRSGRNRRRSRPETASIKSAAVNNSHPDSVSVAAIDQPSPADD